MTKGVIEVGDDVFDVFDAHGDSYQTIGDPKPGPLMRRNRCVGHGGRVADQGLDPAKTLRQRTQFDIIQHSACCRKRPGLKGDHSAKAGEEFAGAIVLGMLWKSGIVDVEYSRVFIEECGYPPAILVVLAHADGESLDSAGDQKRVEGGEDAPTAFCRKPIRSASSARVVTTTPPTLSLWPLRYLVVEWMTISAPHSMGRSR